MARMEASQEHEEDEMNGDVDGTAESSSADESTAIVRKRTGGNYGATAWQRTPQYPLTTAWGMYFEGLIQA